MPAKYCVFLSALLLLVSCAPPDTPNQVASDPSAPRPTDTYRSGKSLVKSNLDPVVAPDNLFPFQPISQLKEFRHSSGLFTLKVPEGWKINDRLEGGKLAVSWVDPNKNGVISIEVFPSPANANPQELVQVDRQFISTEFGDFPEFFMAEAKPQPDGSLMTVWGYSYTQEQQSARAVFNRFLQQQNGLTVILTVGFLEQNFHKVETPYLQILASFQLDPKTAFPKSAPAQK
jgi:hypothetical protein